MEITCKNAHKQGIWVGICGELGGNFDATEKLLKLGIDEFSISPSKILAMRKAISESTANN